MGAASGPRCCRGREQWSGERTGTSGHGPPASVKPDAPETEQTVAGPSWCPSHTGSGAGVCAHTPARPRARAAGEARLCRTPFHPQHWTARKSHLQRGKWESPETRIPVCSRASPGFPSCAQQPSCALGRSHWGCCIRREAPGPSCEGPVPTVVSQPLFQETPGDGDQP